jgi:hypothetical protein
MNENFKVMLNGLEGACESLANARRILAENPDIQFTQDFEAFWRQSVMEWRELIEKHMAREHTKWEHQIAINARVDERIKALEQR